MPYIFPKRVLADGDVLDPLDLNDDIIPVTEIYGGSLNEHNLKGGSSPGLGGLGDDKIASGVFCSVKQLKKVIDPDMGLPPGPFSRPRLTNVDSVDRVPNDAVWYALPLNSAGDTFISTTTENADVWVEAQVQYSVAPNTMADPVYSAGPSSGNTAKYLSGALDPERGSIFGARIQFAIRLDGAILPWTITGHEDPYHGSPRGEKPSLAYRISSVGELLPNAPGPRVEQDSDLGQLGAFISPVRLGTVVSVSAGSHTIELVARRTNFTDQTLPHIISVYTRKILLLQISQIPRASSSFDSIEVKPFDSESLLDKAAFDESVVAARTRLNAVRDGAVARGALRDVHLPQSYLGSFSNFRTGTGTLTTSSVFPGFTNTTAVNVNPGWEVFLSSSVTHTSTSPVNNSLVIFADAHVQHLQRAPASGEENDVMGALAIVFSTDGGANWTVVQDSIVYFNNTQGSFFVNTGSSLLDRAMSRVNLNVPTMTVLNIPSPDSGTTYTVAIAGCVVPTILTQTTPVPFVFSHYMRVQRMSLSGFILRGI
jgi:hypothetical protein